MGSGPSIVWLQEWEDLPGEMSQAIAVASPQHLPDSCPPVSAERPWLVDSYNEWLQRLKVCGAAFHALREQTDPEFGARPRQVVTEEH